MHAQSHGPQTLGHFIPRLCFSVPRCFSLQTFYMQVLAPMWGLFRVVPPIAEGLIATPVPPKEERGGVKGNGKQRMTTRLINAFGGISELNCCCLSGGWDNTKTRAFPDPAPFHERVSVGVGLDLDSSPRIRSSYSCRKRTPRGVESLPLRCSGTSRPSQPRRMKLYSFRPWCLGLVLT